MVVGSHEAGGGLESNRQRSIMQLGTTVHDIAGDTRCLEASTAVLVPINPASYSAQVEPHRERHDLASDTAVKGVPPAYAPYGVANTRKLFGWLPTEGAVTENEGHKKNREHKCLHPASVCI